MLKKKRQYAKKEKKKEIFTIFQFKTTKPRTFLPVLWILMNFPLGSASEISRSPVPDRETSKADLAWASDMKEPEVDAVASRVAPARLRLREALAMSRTGVPRRGVDSDPEEMFNLKYKQTIKKIMDRG